MILQIGMHAGGAGGADRYYDGLFRELRRSSEPVQGFVFGEQSHQDGLRCLAPISLGTAARLKAMRSAYADLVTNEGRPQLVATHFALYALPLLDHLRKKGEGTHLTHFHGPWAAESAAQGAGRLSIWMKKRVERTVYSRCPCFIVLSEAFGSVLVRDYGVARDRIHVVPGGIDVSVFGDKAASLPRAKARHRLGWNEARPTVVAVRRLAKRMGLDRLIEAAQQVRESAPDIQVMIAGKGPEGDALQRMIDSLGLSEHVRLLGFVPEEDLPLVYRAADVSLVPSRSLEGFGLVILESLAVGTPALVTPVGGMPEVVNGLSPALVLADCTPEAIAGGIVRALSEPSGLPDEKTCRDYVLQNHDWSVIGQRVLEVYRQAIVESSRHAPRDDPDGNASRSA